MSLTTVRRCGTVAGKELKNSEPRGTRTRKPCGFFMPARFTSGGRQPYNTRKGKAARRLGSVLNLPTPTGAARKNVSLCSSHSLGDVFMTQSIIPFNFHSHAVRVVMRDGNPWFVATDVCTALGYRNPSKAIADHLDDDERSNEQLDRSRMGSKAVIISESGLYALILRSRKPEARKFAKWVTSEVMPSIRKTGVIPLPQRW